MAKIVRFHKPIQGSIYCKQERVEAAIFKLRMTSFRQKAEESNKGGKVCKFGIASKRKVHES